MSIFHIRFSVVHHIRLVEKGNIFTANSIIHSGTILVLFSIYVHRAMFWVNGMHCLTAIKSQV